MDATQTFATLGAISAALARIFTSQLRGDEVGERDGRRWLAALPAPHALLQEMVRSELEADPLLRSGFVARPPTPDAIPVPSLQACRVLGALCSAWVVLLDRAAPRRLGEAGTPDHDAMAWLLQGCAALTGVE